MSNRARVKSGRSRLFQAIAVGLLLGSIAVPAVAQSHGVSADACSAADAAKRMDCQTHVMASLRGQSRFFNNNPAVISPPNAAPQEGPINGMMGDPDSWKTEEFLQDWGLEATNAHHAYARGLSGAGIRVGLFDSGAALNHQEFAGKDARGLIIGDLLADGTRCAPDFAVGGPDACFGTDGGRPSVSATYYDPELAPFIRPEFAHYIDNIVLAYESHGTHVAGTMTANRDGQGMHGVAFGATFSSARLFADSYTKLDLLCAFIGICDGESTSASVSAFEDMYAQMNAQGVRAINHSWGLSREPATPELQDTLYQHPENASRWEALRKGSLDKGMIQVWAAGNSGINISPEASPIAGIYASLPRHMPELEQYWLSVVNVGRTGDENNPYILSNQSMKCGPTMNWCLAAPGSVINSTVDNGEGFIGDLERDEHGNIIIPGIADIVSRMEYADFSGTSMAAPHVTGALALLFERYPYLTNPQVRDILLTTATDMGAAGVDDVYGWGLMNLKKAIEGYGQFRVDTDVVMNQKAGGAHVWNDARVWDDWTNDIGGPGRLSFDSANNGWLRLSGDNSFQGLTVKGGVLELTGQNALGSDVEVDGGMLRVSGQGVLQNNVNVNAGGALGGTGTIEGDTRVAGIIAPGASIGTLTVNGDYTQLAGSQFVVEMQPPSATDQLVVNGTATLNGGTVVAMRMPGVFSLGQSYNFLTASGGISGQFAGVDNSALGTFLRMALRYDANSVYADVIRAAALNSVALTANQRATATALDSLADSNALLQALVLLPTAAQGNAAFDQLSGEIHPSVRGVLADDSRHVRNAALARARTGHDAFTGQSAGPGFALWANVLSNGGSLEGNSNAAEARYSGLQMLVGADYQFDNGWRIGALGGTGDSDINIGRRASEADVKTRMVGIYGGQNWGGFGVHGGYTHAWHETDTSRKVAFTNFSDGLEARYDGTTDQAFIEGGYRFGGASWEVEPYLQYANVRVESDGFAERGGLAAITANGAESSLDLTTGGVRFSANLKGSQQEQTWLSLRGGLAHRQASGDLAGASGMQLAGSSSYVVLGAPVAKKATIGELGFAARLSDRTLLEVGYNGQFADEGDDHGAMARLSVKF